ncbi:hypothetical protein [Streptomyces sp. 150FB]|uniref:hypothetical protein n=1 Tax=Streptomyces sp. 150FB TaxID=1576605 RepID=UPI0012379FFE|nr:hypothetical protein [Streptomyces sp. 150FB]
MKGVTLMADHVRADFDLVTDGTWLSCADVLYGTGGPELADGLLRRYPGALLVVVRDRGDGRCTAVTRDGARIPAGRVRGAWEHAVLASVLHALFRVALSRCPDSAAAHGGAGCRRD